MKKGKAKSMVMKPLFRLRQERPKKGAGSYSRKGRGMARRNEPFVFLGCQFSVVVNL